MQSRGLQQPRHGQWSRDHPAGGSDFQPRQFPERLSNGQLLVSLMPSAALDMELFQAKLVRMPKQHTRCLLMGVQFYSASFTGDIRGVIQHVRTEYPLSLLMAAGWSLGANVLVSAQPSHVPLAASNHN